MMSGRFSPCAASGNSVCLAVVAGAFALAGMFGGSARAQQMTPEEHAKHHAGAAQPGQPPSTPTVGPTSGGMGDMMKGMDRIGRVLFQLYWHREAFEERYGKQHVPELEDMLRNSFEDVGDLVLDLKQKTIEADPGAAGQKIDFKSDTND